MFRTGLLAISVALSSAYAMPAKANFISGNILFQKCSSAPNSQEKAFCLAFIVGVSDAHETVFDALEKKPFCLPSGATGRQVMDVAIQYLEQHPESRHYTASSTVGLALIKAFPCPTAK